jgi:hypothetical protein
LAENRIDKSSNISVMMVNIANKKLVKFYENLSFVYDKQSYFYTTTAEKLLEKLSFYSSLNFSSY